MYRVKSVHLVTNRILFFSTIAETVDISFAMNVPQRLPQWLLQRSQCECAMFASKKSTSEDRNISLQFIHKINVFHSSVLIVVVTVIPLFVNQMQM